MNRKEAVNAMLDGKKVYYSGKGAYMYFNPRKGFRYKYDGYDQELVGSLSYEDGYKILIEETVEVNGKNYLLKDIEALTVRE